MRSMEAYPRAAMERAMKVQEVLLRAMARKITWFQAAEILVPRPCNVVSSIAEFRACFSAGKAPVDGYPITVHSPAPSSGFPPQVVQRGDSSPSQTLPGEQADFDLCLIEPAAVGGRIVHREPAPQPAAGFLAIPLHHGLASVRTEIVHHQMDGVGGGIVFDNLQ